VVATVTVGNSPSGVAVTPDGKHAYVTNNGNQFVLGTTVSVIDTATNTVVGTPIPVGKFPIRVAITPDGKHAYVTNAMDNNVSVIATASNTVVGPPIMVGANPIGVAVTPDGKNAYVANLRSNNVSVIDTTSNTVVAGPPSTTPLMVGNGPAGVGIGPTLALQNVANTSQKGSLLIFPLIHVFPENTLIEISNDQNTQVHVECIYVNEKKGRVDFDFHLTGKATLSWEVLTGSGDIAAPRFPTGGAFPGGNAARGELICIATDVSIQNQIAWNHLTGTATVIDLNDPAATQHKQAFRYNPWSFIARDATGQPAADGTIQGTPGNLQLTGANDGKSYDGCPAYNIVNFMPNGATLNGVHTIDNDLSVVSCNQDLRQDFRLHLTTLKFTEWNENENSFTGTFICVDSVKTAGLDSFTTGLVNGFNFDFSTLRTDNARFQMKGVKSDRCPGSTETVGLLGVATASLALGGDPSKSQEVGSTTQGAGLLPGFVLWDPAGSVPAASIHAN
jgi:YVTN family beta-propeller protein